MKGTWPRGLRTSANIFAAVVMVTSLATSVKALPSGAVKTVQGTDTVATLATPTPANFWLLDPRLFSIPVRKYGNKAVLSPIIDRRPGVSNAFLNEINNAIQKLPPKAVALLQKRGYKITVSRTITDAVPAAKNQQVRGYEAHATWNSVYGMFNRTTRRVIMAENAEQKDGYGRMTYSKLHDQSRRAGILRHEFGHAIDHYLGNFSHSPEFVAAYNKGLKTISVPEQAVLSYYLQPGHAGMEEAFAEIFASLDEHACDKGSDALLHNHFGEAAKLVRAKVNSILG
jgi:hypothetical protein